MSTEAQREADNALAALALVEAVNEDNAVNVRSIMSTTSTTELVHGLVGLASSLRYSLAFTNGVPLNVLDEQIRAMLFVSAERSC